LRLEECSTIEEKEEFLINGGANVISPKNKTV